jgi:hypothetical protein
VVDALGVEAGLAAESLAAGLESEPAFDSEAGLDSVDGFPSDAGADPASVAGLSEELDAALGA